MYVCMYACRYVCECMYIRMCVIVYNVAYLFKARTVEPEKQPLLANGSETTFVSRQRSQTNRFPRQVSAPKNIGTVGKGGFYSVPAKRL
jgi:hypothetical protein